MPRHAAAVLAYAALTFAYTWPMVLRLGSVAPNDLGDPLLSTWTLWWNATTLPLSDRWWNGPIFFPAPDALTLSDHRIGIGIITTPAIWLGWSPIAAHNLAFLASFVLCAVGGYALGFALTHDHGAAFLAGLVFGFNPFRAGHLPHLELLCSYWLPVALLALHRWGETRKGAWLVALSIALTMQALTSTYYFAFFGVIVGLWLLWFVRLRLPLRDYLVLGASLCAPLLIIAPILLRYRRAHESMGLARTIVDIETFSADLVGLVTTPQTLALWNSPLAWGKGEGALYPGAVAAALVVAGLLVAVPPPAPALPRWGQRFRRALPIGAAIAAFAAAIPVVWGPVSTEVLGLPVSVSQSFKPISVAVLLIGLWLLTTARVRREWRARLPLAFFALATVAMWLFALGPTGRAMGERFLYKAPYSWLMLLPGIDTAFRVPARFGMLAALTLCAATALAWAGLTRGRSRPATAVATAAAALAILSDSWIKPMQLPSLPPRLEIPDNTPPDAVVLKLPLETFEDAEAMYQAIDHRRPSVNGMSGHAPASYQVLHSAMGEGRVDVLAGLTPLAPLVVFVDRAAAGEHLTSQMRAFPSATLLRQDAMYDVLLIPRAVRPSNEPFSLNGGLMMQSGRASVADDSVTLMSDGDLHTAWMTTTQEDLDEFIADLGAPHQVRGVALSLGPFPGRFPRRVSVLTSTDGVEWSEVWNGSGAAPSLSAAIANQREVPIQLSFDPHSTRFVRVRQVDQSSSSVWAVAEFRALVN